MFSCLNNLLHSTSKVFATKYNVKNKIECLSLCIFVNECFECSIENSFQDPPTVEPAIILGLSLTAVLFVLVFCCLYWKFIYPNRHNLYRLPFIKHFHRADNGKYNVFFDNHNIHRYYSNTNLYSVQ